MPKSKMTKKQARLGYLFLLPSLAVIVALMVYPLSYGIRTSFFEKSLIGPERYVGFGNFKSLLDDPIFWDTLVNTIIWTFTAVAGGLLIGLALASLLNVSIRFRGRLISRVLLIIPWAFPNVAAVIIWRWMFREPFGYLNALFKLIGLMNQPVNWLGSNQYALLAAIIVAIWKSFPFDMLVLYAAMQAIPTELYEGAQIDGANVWQRFRSITLPLLLPSILIITLLQTIWTFNNFDIVFVLTRGGPLHASEILPTYIYKSAFETYQAGYGSAIATVMFLILVFIAVLYVNVYKKIGETS